MATAYKSNYKSNIESESEIIFDTKHYLFDNLWAVKEAMPSKQNMINFLIFIPYHLVPDSRRVLLRKLFEFFL